MSFSYTPGLHHVGCYQVSGYPNVANGTLGSALDVLDYDYVTKEIVVMNTYSSSIYVLFNYTSPDSSKFEIKAGEQHTFDVKTRRVYISGSSGATYSVCASLTSIGKERITAELEGQGITTTPTIT